MMVVGDVLSLPNSVLIKLGEIGLLLQALGVIIVIWIVFQIVQLWMNRKRLRKIDEIQNDMKRIERKIDRITVKSR